MPASEICNRNVVVMRQEESVTAAAGLMRRHHVGDVIVVDQKDGFSIPVGIVTDRDIVIEVVSKGLDPESLSVGEIMAPELATIEGGKGLTDAIEYMRSKGVRRLPVIDERGALLGILALDDLLELLAEELSALARLLANERKREERTRA